MRNAVVIAANELRRMIRDRATLFFVFVLPLALIVVLGSSAAGGSQPRIGIVPAGQGPYTQDLIAGIGSIERSEASVHTDLDEALEQLRREDLTMLVAVPADYDERLAAGEPVELRYLSIPNGDGFQIQGLVQSVVAEQNEQLRAAAVVAGQTGDSPPSVLALVREAADDVVVTEVATVDPDGRPFTELPVFDVVASQEVILFMFLTSMTAAAALIQAKRIGVVRRMLATPASASEVLAGHALGRYGLAVVQSLFIVAATAMLFGIEWYSWAGTLAVIVTFGLTSTAAAMLVGALVANESQSTAIGLALGLSLAAFGGCMVPLDVFPEGLRTAAHLTPHAWVNDAFDALREGGGLAGIGREVGVLAGYGAATLLAGTAALRRSIIAR